MRLALKPHPDSHCTAVTRIDVDVARPRRGGLVLRYLVSGDIGDLRMPPVTVSSRADELWQRTCFEAFIRAGSGPAYYEFNFSPSTQWAVYRFNDTRRGMDVARGIGAPHIKVQSNGGRHSLRATLDLEGLPDLPDDAAWRLALSAVIEEANGRKSHWALAHPPGEADFHHPDCFACDVPAAR